MPKFDLKISPDKMTAHLVIEPEEDGETISAEIVSQYLKRQNVLFGIKEENINTALENKSWSHDILVAEGKNPVEGKNGRVEYFFDPDPGNAPKERENGSLDFHHLNKIQNTTSGQKLARLIPSVDGQDGKNIHGESIKAEKVKTAKLLRGKNTTYNEDKTEIISEIDGVIILRSDGTIEVSPKCNIDGDIDHSTGDIEIKGDLIVKGDIKSGFKAVASGNIEIGGTVEEATVIAGGLVTVKGGFVGEGGGLIKSGGNVFVKFINRQRVECGGDLEIFEEARGAMLTAGGMLLIKKGKGILAGGEARAAKAMEVNMLGSPQNISTLAIVADTSKFLEKISTRQKEIEGLNEKSAELIKKISFLNKKMKKVGLTVQEEQLFRKLDKLSADIDITIETLRKEIKEADAAIGELKKTAYLKVVQNTYPGVTMKIAGTAKHFDIEREATTFKVYSGKIIGMEEMIQAAQKG